MDAATPADRQKLVFAKVLEVLDTEFPYADKSKARRQMFEVTDLFRNWNYAATGSDEYQQWLERIDQFLS